MTEADAKTTLRNIINDAIDDPKKRLELIENPNDVLARAGIQGLDDVTVVVHINRPGVVHLVLPQSPRDPGQVELGDVDIAVIVEITGHV